jgi:2-polyprenyl-3-methyl-5-hydroxy-6-metoxy-1,4-benzoquinol methylase
LRRNLSEYDQSLYRYIDEYLYEYCRFYGLTAKDVLQIRERFAEQYQFNLANFVQSRKYPRQLDDQIWPINRIEYDVILILSFLLEKHRFHIASWLTQNISGNDILCIGVGPGVELGIVSEFLSNTSRTIVGYDLSVSDFVRSRFGTSVHQEYFVPDGRHFDAVVLIEILEHLADPQSMLFLASKSLDANGRLFLTTAIDVPQFDHQYNFVHGEIAEMLAINGLQVDSIIKIMHTLNFSPARPANELVIASVGRA